MHTKKKIWFAAALLLAVLSPSFFILFALRSEQHAIDAELQAIKTEGWPMDPAAYIDPKYNGAGLTADQWKVIEQCISDLQTLTQHIPNEDWWELDDARRAQHINEILDALDPLRELPAIPNQLNANRDALEFPFDNEMVWCISRISFDLYLDSDFQEVRKRRRDFARDLICKTPKMLTRQQARFYATMGRIVSFYATAFSDPNEEDAIITELRLHGPSVNVRDLHRYMAYQRALQYTT